MGAITKQPGVTEAELIDSIVSFYRNVYKRKHDIYPYIDRTADISHVKSALRVCSGSGDTGIISEAGNLMKFISCMSPEETLGHITRRFLQKKAGLSTGNDLVPGPKQPSQETLSFDKETVPEEDAYKFILDAMSFESDYERDATLIKLMEYVESSLGDNNRYLLKHGKKPLNSIKELNIYKVASIVYEAKNKELLNWLLSSKGIFGRRTVLSALANMAGAFPWKWQVEIGTYTVKGKKRFYGPPAVEGQPHQPEEKNIAARKDLHIVVEKQEHPEEDAIDTEIRSLKEGIASLEALFNAHIHDVRTGQPYKPARLGLVG